MIEITLGSLIVLIAMQQWFYMREVQKLVDKVMSRSYTEYTRAKDPVPRVQLPNEPMEDLRTLQEFSL